MSALHRPDPNDSLISAWSQTMTVIRAKAASFGFVLHAGNQLNVLDTSSYFTSQQP